VRTWTLGPTFATLLLGVGAAASQAHAEDDFAGADGGEGPQREHGGNAANAMLSSATRAGVYERREASAVQAEPERAPPGTVRNPRYDTDGLVESTDISSTSGEVVSNINTARAAHLANAISVPVRTAYAAPLYASEDTCMGSRTFGVQAMGFGVSFATTWQDRQCRRIKNARQLFALGYRSAAVALLCQDDEVYDAMERAGTPCPRAQFTPVDAQFEPAPEPEIEPPPIASYAVLFDFDSSRLRPEADDVLAPLLAQLQADPSMRIDIEGHTDSVGSDAYNLRLSRRRAQAVVEWLVAHGIDRARITAVGRGEAEPVEQNDSLPGRQANRRVEIRRH
jgi:outer membrane protein OmpA-like peptidoglycan-associated protein